MGDIQKILMIQGESQYDAISCFMNDLADGFRQLGCRVDILGGITKDALDRTIYFEEYDVVLSFFGITSVLYDAINRNPNTLFFLFLVDHPYYRYDWLAEQHRNLIVSCIDRNHCNFLQKYYKNIDAVQFVPHGGNLSEKPPKPFADREIDVAFFGTCSASNEYKSIVDQMSEDIMKIMDATIARVMQGECIPAEEILIQELRSGGIELSEAQLLELFVVLAFADTYIRAKQREKLILHLAKSGLEVHVYGNGWEKDELAQYENIKRHGAVSYTEALDIMTNTKIVINKMPLFLDGSHERVFTAMLNGAVCCTDESGYWKQEFIDGESICFYDFHDLDNLENIIKELLLNLDKAGKIAQNGYDIAIHKHQWKNRAEQILEICNKVSRIEDINYVLPGTKNAYAFNRFLDYANDKDIEMLVQKTRMYENKLQYQKNVYHAMETYYQKNYRESMNHAIVNRITSVKHALGEYAWLYGQCEDNLSKCTLAGLLNYWISMEYRHVKDVADHRYKAYADWDILDMEEFSQAVFLGAEQADSIQAVVDYNYDLLDAIEVFAPNQMTKERICGALHSSDMEVMVCEPDILKTINLDEVFDSRVRFIALMGARYAEEIIRNMEQHIRANKPQLAIRVSVEYGRYPFAAIVAMSAEKHRQLYDLLLEIEKLLPESIPYFDPDLYTDKSPRFLAAETIREKAFRLLGDELPYGTAVTIDKWKEETDDKGVRRADIVATLIVDRESHKPIVIGEKGAKLREISRLARANA